MGNLCLEDILRGMFDLSESISVRAVRFNNKDLSTIKLHVKRD